MKVQIILSHLKKILESENFKNNYRVRSSYFTRNRKVGFINLIYIILNMLKKSTQIELDKYLKRFIFKTKCFSYTKQSFSKARQKILAQAFKYLNNELIRKFYETETYKKYKDYRLLAIDGIFLEIPDNIETQSHYGYVTNGKEGFKIARAISSKIYDLENDILVNSVLGKYTDGERDLAIKNINEMLENSNLPEKNIILFDKAYPSIDFIEHLNSKKIKYFMKIKANTFEEVKLAKSFGQIVKIIVTRERSKTLKRRGLNYEIGKTIIFRVFKFVIDGDEEIVITNLEKNELSYEEALSLYHKRWGIEIKFNELKNRFEIENFSGEKITTIEQDFYAITLISNIAALISNEATEKVQQKNKLKKLKYTYKINKNLLIGKLKDNLIEILIQENPMTISRLYNRLVSEIQRNVVPIIKGRNFKKKKKSKSNKYSKSYRRAL